MSSYPAKFGKYLLLERVNVGGMAEVFKAKAFGAAGFERILAIKRILPNLVEDDEFVKMFIDEARIAVQLTHANIVQIFELGRHGDHYYIAMEYLASRDLRGILDRMRANGQLMPIPQAAFITAKACEGLDYAHKRRDADGVPMNIIHRDVSPQNILIGFEGEVKVIDFGIAKAANRASKTQAGVLKGKFGYMSPEQVRGLPIDRRSDIFAVGVLLYEMLTGERLFIGESDFSTLERVRNAEVTPPTSFNKKITPQLEKIVLKALAREVEDRYQWAADLAEELQPFLVEEKQVFNMKRLAALMKDQYSVEIALERQKAEEFLRVTPDDAKPERGNSQSSILPLHVPSGEGKAGVKLAPPPPPPPPPRGNGKPAARAPVEEPPPDDSAEAFGEDKTFVIEASAAGRVLQNQVTEEPEEKPAGNGAVRVAGKGSPQPAIGAGAEPSGTGKKPASAKPEPTNDDYLNQVSLYDDEGSNEDDSRTLVSAANPFFEKGASDPRDPTGEEDDEIDASEALDDDASKSPHTRLGGELSDAPTMMAVDRTGPGTAPGAASHSEQSATRTAYRAEQGPPPPPAAMRGGALDPVAAAMAEEERLAAEIVRGASRGAAVAPPPRGNDIAGPQLPVVDRAEGRPSAPTTALAPPTESTSEVQAAPRRVPAALPKNLVPITVGAVALSLVLFVAVTTAGVLRWVRSQTTTLTLYAVGAPPPPDVRVTVDGTHIGGLPSSAQLSEGEHAIVVEGTGIARVDRIFRGAGGAVKQPVLLVPAGKARPPAAAPTEAAPTEAAPPRTPDEPTPPTPTAGVVAGGWRLSLAAVADDSGNAIAGAEVFINGAAVGHTPYEGEVDAALRQVELQIKKPGYVTRSIKVERGERSAVGPATVRLPPGGDTAAAGTDTPGEPATVVAVPVDKAPPVVPPADKPPADKPLVVPPADKPPADKPPVVVAKPADKPPADKPVADKPKTPPADKPPADKPAEDKPAGSKKLAQLQIGTQPFAETLIDGKPYGATPFYNHRALKLSLGTHRVDFIDKATGKKHQYRITILEDDPENKAVIILGKPDMQPKVQGKIKVKLVN